MVTISAKAYDRLKRLADDEGRFFMLAIDQRGSIKKMLAKVVNVEPNEVPRQAISTVKRVIIEELAPEATAVLIDPEYGFDGGYQAIPNSVGRLLTLEKSGGEKVVIAGVQEERTVLLNNWSVEQAVQKGADAVKLLVPYHPRASEETRKSQESLVKQIGLEGQERDLPLLVELTSYPVGSSPDQLKDERLTMVAETAQLFDQSDFGITIHKIEFPGDIDTHSPAELIEACQRVDLAVTKPWVLLSAGVEFDIFEKEVAIACSNGASGFLAGRAIWQEAVGWYDSEDSRQLRMRAWLANQGVTRLQRLKAAGRNARHFSKRINPQY